MKSTKDSLRVNLLGSPVSHHEIEDTLILGFRHYGNAMDL